MKYPTYKPSLFYRIFKVYVQWSERRFYRHLYFENDAVIRNFDGSEGTMLMLVSNHNNTGLDAIIPVLHFPNECKVYSIARADAFAVSPILKKVFHWIGMTAAYRREFGLPKEALSRNLQLFEFTSDQMINGHPLLLYPEGIHHVEHYLNNWLTGYTKIAFMAARKSNYERDVIIVPSCNDYSNYYTYHADAMIRYGEPVSLKPFYELHKEKPGAAQNAVNQLVLDRVRELTLDIQDRKNYWAIDWLCHSEWGHNRARNHGFDPEILPQLHDACKKLVADLEKVEDRESLQGIYDEVMSVRAEEKRLGIDEQCLEENDSPILVAMDLLWLLVSLPLWILTCVPGAIMYFLPRYFAAFDMMYASSIIFIANVLLLFPLLVVLMLLIPGIMWGAWIPAFIWVLLQPLCWPFAWQQGQMWITTIKDLKRLCHNKAVAALKERRKALWRRLTDICK